MDRGGVEQYRTLLKIHPRLAWKKVSEAEEIKGIVQTELEPDLLELGWIMGQALGQDVVNMKAAEVEELSGIGALLLVGQPDGFPLGCAEFLVCRRSTDSPNY